MQNGLRNTALALGVAALILTALPGVGADGVPATPAKPVTSR